MGSQQKPESFQAIAPTLNSFDAIEYAVVTIKLIFKRHQNCL